MTHDRTRHTAVDSQHSSFHQVAVNPLHSLLRLRLRCTEHVAASRGRGRFLGHALDINPDNRAYDSWTRIHTYNHVSFARESLKQVVSRLSGKYSVCEQLDSRYIRDKLAGMIAELRSFLMYLVLVVGVGLVEATVEPLMKALKHASMPQKALAPSVNQCR